MRATRIAGAGDRGSSLIEFALVLPVLLLLAFVVYDFARAIQINNVLVNLTREGASLMSRSVDSPQFAQFVMNALGDTALPKYADTGQTGAYFESGGAILITRIQGRSNPVTKNVDATLTEQYKWLKASTTPSSQLWNCGNNWKADGSCAMPATLPVVALPVALNDGDVVYVVEGFFSYQALFGGMSLGQGFGVPTIGPDLYAAAMF